MREHITHVAFDMHRHSITAAWLLPRASNPELRTVPHEVKPFRRLVRRILSHGPACACYEASPLGYAPQRQLAAWGLPRLRRGDCPEPRAPAPGPADQDRQAGRQETRGPVPRGGTPVSPHPYPGGGGHPGAGPLPGGGGGRGPPCPTTAPPVPPPAGAPLSRWPSRKPGVVELGPDAPAPPTPPPSEPWRSTASRPRRSGLARRRWMPRWQRWPPGSPGHRLWPGSGASGASIPRRAVAVLLEGLAFRRFARPRPCMGFVELVPSEDSSGETKARGCITKTGNAHLRRVLVETAWHYRVPPGCRPCPSKAIQARRAGQPPAVVAVAEQAEQRRHRRFASPPGGSALPSPLRRSPGSSAASSGR